MGNHTLVEATPQPQVQPGGASASPRIGILGVTGYAGAELARLLLRHPRCNGDDLSFYGRPHEDPEQESPLLSEVHPHLRAEDSARVQGFSWDAIDENGVEILLMATPHDQSQVWAPEAVRRGIRVIDLSGAWRLKHPEHRGVYRFEEELRDTAALRDEAVYGSPELHKDAIRTARLVSNPGCYATSIILALAPLLGTGMVDLDHGIVCDAKSGVSGAGKTPSPGTHFMYAADNLSAYSVFGHRHIGELLEQLHVSESQIQFTPHLLPIPRGILSTIYLRLSQSMDAEEITERMREFYRDCPFVRVRQPGMLPQIQHVVHSNFCDVGVAVQKNTRRVVIVSCLDNLLKGAAGQAIQNMNLMLGWGETEGLL